MAHIFISYSHLDAEYVRRLAQALEQEGFSPWVDDRIDYGSTWDEEVQRRLDGCAAFILVMTPNSSASRWVKNELNRAMRKNKPIFPLLLEGDEPWLAVESIQFMDVRGGKLPDERFFQHIAKVAVRETPAQKREPVVVVEETSQPNIVDEKNVQEEAQPSKIIAAEILEQRIPPQEKQAESELRARLIPAETPFEEKSILPQLPVDRVIVEEIPAAEDPIKPGAQIELVTEKKTEEKKVASVRTKKGKEKREKQVKVKKTALRSPANKRKWMIGSVIGGLIVVCLGAIGATLWIFREPLGLTVPSEGTATFGQGMGKTPTQSPTFAIPTPTLVPLPEIPITIENAGLVTELRRWGDGGVINQVVINSPGDRLAVGTSQGVYVFDPVSLEQLDYLAYDVDVTTLAFTKDGSLLAIGLGNHSIEVKSVEALHDGAIHSLEAEAAIQSLAFDPYGLYLAAGLEDGVIQVWSMEDDSLLNNLEGHENVVTAVAFLEDTLLASASLDGTIRLWKIPGGTLEETLAAQAEGVTCLGYSLGASILAAGGKDGSIQVWSVPERKILYPLEGHSGKVFSLAMSPAGKQLASTADDGLRVWNLRTTEAVTAGSLEGHFGPADTTLAFALDGVTLFSGGRTDGTIRSWNVDSRLETGRLDQFATPVLFSALSPDNKLLAQRMGGTVHLWNIAEEIMIRDLDVLFDSHMIGFSQDGKYLGGVTPSGMSEVTVAEGSIARTEWDTAAEMTTAAYNPVFDKVAVGYTDGLIRIFDFRSNLLETWGTAQSGKGVNLLEYCKNSSFLAASYEDGSLVIWKETGGDPLEYLHILDAGQIRAMSFGPGCGSLLMAGEDGRLRYLPYDTGVISDLSLPAEVSSIGRMEFSPDWKILAIATNEYEIALLDFDKMELLNVLKGHTKDITSLILRRDSPFITDLISSLLISTSLDGTTRLWGVAP